MLYVANVDEEPVNMMVSHSARLCHPTQPAELQWVDIPTSLGNGTRQMDRQVCGLWLRECPLRVSPLEGVEILIRAQRELRASRIEELGADGSLLSDARADSSIPDDVEGRRVSIG